MSIQTEQPFAWIRQIPGDLFQLDEKPLIGFPPAFDWNAFAVELGKSLQIKDLSFEPSTWQWRPREELFDGLGKEIRGLPLALAPLSGGVWWAMAEQEIKRLMATVLANQGNGDIDNDFIQAFYHFIAAEALNAFEKTIADKKLSASLAREEGLPDAHCLCMDVAINLSETTLHGRLFLSPELRSAWKQRYMPQKPNLSLSPMINSLDVIVNLEAGRIDLKLSEWKQIKTGDFLFLDNCSLDPDEDKGRVMLVINGIPCFRARIKQGSLKILEHPLYFEANKSMDAPTNKDDEDLDLDSSADFDIDDISDSELNLEEAPKKAAAAAPAAKPAAKAAEAPAGEAVAATKVATAPLSVEDVPLPVIIEVGRIQMAVKKLLELQPGNLLELDIHPESGVDLVVNGKRIARGELLRIGEALGVRILELS